MMQEKQQLFAFNRRMECIFQELVKVDRPKEKQHIPSTPPTNLQARKKKKKKEKENDTRIIFKLKVSSKIICVKFPKVNELGSDCVTLTTCHNYLPDKFSAEWIIFVLRGGCGVRPSKGMNSYYFSKLRLVHDRKEKFVDSWYWKESSQLANTSIYVFEVKWIGVVGGVEGVKGGAIYGGEGCQVRWSGV